MTWDSTWDDVFRQQEWGRYPGERTIQFIARNFYARDRGSVRILEIGSGPGANLWYMAREGLGAYGIDGSQVAVEQARARLASEGLVAEMRVGDVTGDLPWPDGFFDAVVDVECLCTNPLDAARRALLEASRVLADGGLLYSQTFSDETYVGDLDRSGSLEYKSVEVGPLADEGFVRLVRREEIPALYGECFEILSVDTSFHTLENGTVPVGEWVILARKRSIDS